VLTSSTKQGWLSTLRNALRKQLTGWRVKTRPILLLFISKSQACNNEGWCDLPEAIQRVDKTVGLWKD